jgi:serine/threonine-protein kinase
MACFIFALVGSAWLLGEHHVATLGEAYLIVCAASMSLFCAVIFWMLYISLEPFVRRHLPGWLVGWNRLLAGNIRDPLVGRDLLAGYAMAIIFVLLNCLRFPFLSLFGALPIRPSAVLIGQLEAPGSARGIFYLFSGNHAAVAWILWALFISILIGLIISFWVFLLRVLLRRTWAAAIAFLFIGTAINATIGEPSLISIVSIALAVATFLFVLFRFGLLAFIAGAFFYTLLLFFPITTQLSAWYSRIGFAGLALLLAFALYAFHTSLGGQPMFGRASLED